MKSKWSWKLPLKDLYLWLDPRHIPGGQPYRWFWITNGWGSPRGLQRSAGVSGRMIGSGKAYGLRFDLAWMSQCIYPLDLWVWKKTEVMFQQLVVMRGKKVHVEWSPFVTWRLSCWGTNCLDRRTTWIPCPHWHFPILGCVLHELTGFLPSTTLTLVLSRIPQYLCSDRLHSVLLWSIWRDYLCLLLVVLSGVHWSFLLRESTNGAPSMIPGPFLLDDCSPSCPVVGLCFGILEGPIMERGLSNHECWRWK